MEIISHPSAHKYQTRAAAFALDAGCCYWMIDMGLGKTLITLISQHNLNEPMLVVAPLRPLYDTWPAEIEKWFPTKKCVILHGAEKDFNFIQDADFYLINPEGFKWLEAKCARFKPKFKHLVIDEGSLWKSHATKRFKIVKGLLHMFKCRFVLSGTPSPQGLMDLWSQYYLLDGGKRLGRAIGKFRDQFFNVHLVNNQFPEYRPKLGALEAVMEKVADITFRLDAADYIQLPDLLYNNISIDMGPLLVKQYKQLEKEFVLELESCDVEAFNAATLSSKLRQFVQGGIYSGEGKERTWELIHTQRIKALKELMEEAGQPILCAIQFRFELEMIREAFGRVPYIGGGVSAKEGSAIIGQWNKGELPLLVCHPRSLSHGANLQTGGNIVLWYGLTWSLEQYMQLIKRLHRQGQKNAVVVHHFIAKGTIDERVAKALAAKESVQGAVLDYFRGRY